jgi:hypothetical protein
MNDVDIRASTATRGRSDFGAILAGALVTVSVGIALLALGAAIGFSSLDPAQGDWGGKGLLIGGGAWTMIAIVLATLVGAMTSVRLSAHYGRAEAAAQGFSSWAMAFVGTLVFTTWFSAATATAAGSAAGAVGGVLTPEITEQLREQAQGTTPAPTPDRQAAAAGQAAEAGAWASWGFFFTALLAAVAGAAGGVWGLPGGRERVESRGPGVREPLRPADV